MSLADENTQNGSQNSQFPGLDSKGVPSNTSTVLLLHYTRVLDEVTWYTLTCSDTQSWKQRLNRLICLKTLRNDLTWHLKVSDNRYDKITG